MRKVKRSMLARHGFTLMEIIIAMTIICMLVTMSVPIYSQAIEQAHLDAAARDLKAIWSAQRVYWLDNRQYAPDLATLLNMDLLSSKFVLTKGSLTASYVYEIEAADDSSFMAVATRNGSSKWSGEIQIDQFGEINGKVSASDGTVLVPMLTK